MAEGCEGEGIHYVHFTDDGTRQRLRVKGDFDLSLFPSIEPKLKPQPECSELVSARVTGQFWRGGIRASEEGSSFLISVYLPIKSALVRRPNTRVGVHPTTDINGMIIPEYYGLDASIQIPWHNGDFTQCTNTGGEVQVFGGTWTSAPEFSGEGVFIKLNRLPDVYGGIVSVRREDTGEELVEEEEEYCEITVRRKNGSIVMSRKVKGSCGEVQVECENDCPPGHCKCWISRAAKTFCCAKCGNAEVKETPVVNPGSGNGGNGNGNGGSGD